MTESELPSYGVYLLQTLFALGAVCLIGYVVLRVAAKKLYGARRRGSSMAVLDHLPLDQRRSLYIVEVGQRKLLVGGGESGVTLLTELADEDLEEGATTTRPDQSPDPE